MAEFEVVERFLEVGGVRVVLCREILEGVELGVEEAVSGFLEMTVFPFHPIPTITQTIVIST